MASGTINISTQSVDYGGGRGTLWLTNVLNWSTSGNTISFSHNSSSDNMGNTWMLYSAQAGADYHLTMAVQVDYGGGWQTVKSVDSPRIGTVAEGGLNAVAASINCVNQLGSVQLAGNCALRILYYANYAPAPTPTYPNAFPDSGFSATTQVPINIEMAYRPGERKINGRSMSLNRAGGACERKGYGTMTTTNGGVGTDNPPSRKQNGTWYNMRKTGAES